MIRWTAPLLALAIFVPAQALANGGRDQLSHEQLMSLAPSPDIRPTYDAAGQIVSGGIGVLVYDGVNVMDVIGPFQVFSTAGLRPFLISASRDAAGNYKHVITTNSAVQLTAHKTIAEVSSLDVLVVTGGAFETANLAADAAVVGWIRAIHETTVWTTSVCTGAWVLGAAGLLQGKKATGNWYRVEELLTHFGAIPKLRRYVFDGKIATAAGVTAGIDMALAIVQRVFRGDLNKGRDFTQAVMLDLEYDPDPPVRGGSKDKTDPYVYEGMQAMYDFFGLGEYVLSIPVQP